VVNKEIMMHNIKTMHEQVKQSNGVQLRPHIKTHKSIRLAKLQTELGNSGITCAKLSEAKVMIDGGIDDIFLAYPLVDEEKILESFSYINKVKRFIYSIDTIEGATLLSTLANKNNLKIEARIEIDTGLFRTGFSKEEIEIYGNPLYNLSGLNITGIYTYRGSKDCHGKVEPNTYQAGMEEASIMLTIAKQLRKKGFTIKDISVGSTPTIKGVLAVEGVTEVRVGTYIFNDAMQVAYHVCSLQECAASVFVRVISVHGDRAIIDGGSKSFATDVQPSTPPITMQGFGIVKKYPTIIFDRMNEEHGYLQLHGNHVAVGDILEIIPNHICSTVNLYDSYYFDDGEEIITNARGKTQ
jgi:D-serine deaminase-like pyridoxal phosphate-dependent protein